MSNSASYKSSPATKAGQRGCGLLIGMLFLAGGLIPSWLFVRDVRDAVRARSWVSHPCTVLNAAIERTKGKKGGVTKRATARYEWTWNGQTWQGDRVSFSTGSDNLGSFQQDTGGALIAASGKRDGFRCYVNPDNPREAIIFRGLRWGLTLLFSPFVLLFAPIGVWMALGGIFKSGRAPQGVWEGPESIRQDQPLWHTGAGRFFALWIVVMGALTIGALFLTDDWTAGRVIAIGIAAAALGFYVIGFLRAQRNLRRFGPLDFVPDTLPLVPGSVVTGMIRLRTPPQHLEKAKAWIVVNEIVRQRNRKKGTRTVQLAREDGELTADQYGLGVSVRLPVVAPGLNEQKWELKIAVPGEHLSAAFRLPVQDATPG